MKELRSYQTYASAEIMRLKRLLLADDTGLGKTITAIDVIKRVDGPVLVVVPKTIKLQWYNALIDQGIAATTILTPDAALIDLDLAYRGVHVVLLHYEMLVKHIDQLKRVHWSLVVLDEAHRIKNRKTRKKNPNYGKRPGEPKTISADTQRTKAVYALKADYKLLLTATPYDERNPAEIWSLLHWLDSQFFTSYWRFYDAHINYEICDRYGRIIKEVKKDKPLRDPESFARVIRPYVLRRLKKDVRADLPDRIDQTIDLEMNADQAAIYHTLYDAEINALITTLHDIEAQRLFHNRYAAWALGQIADEPQSAIEISMPIVLTRILRLIQTTTDPALLGHPTASSVKLDWLREWLEDHPDESVIVFTRFREAAIKINGWRLFDKLIVGGRKRENVTTADRRIVGTIAAMGEGLDLPWIDHAIFLDVEWSSIMMTQAIDRIYRINIANVKHVMYLRCAGTVDQLVHDAVERKWSTHQIVEQFLVESRVV